MSTVGITYHRLVILDVMRQFFFFFFFSLSLSLSLSLSQLELGYNPIGPDGAKALSEVLKFNGNVNTLKLGWCQVIIALDCVLKNH